jgi:hypothetical protein
MTDMINKLEQRCDLLSKVVQRQDRGKASLVDNLLLPEDRFTIQRRSGQVSPS